MYVLDANALYWYIGVDKLGFTDQSGVDERKLCIFLDRHQVHCIPSSVYMEIITHFRRQPDKLRIILKFLESKNFKIANNFGGYLCTAYEVSKAFNMNDDELKEYAHRLLQKKINIESGFVLSFAEIVRLLFLEYTLRICHVDDEEDKSVLLQYLGREYFLEVQNEVKVEFTNILTEGYKNNNELREIQDHYIKYLEEGCLFERAFVDLWIANKAGREDLLSELKKSGRKMYGKLSRDNGVMKTIRATALTDKKFLEEAKSKISQMFISRQYSKNQAGYLRDVMFPAWFNSAQKFKKNDIFDMLCAGALDINDPIPAMSVLEDKKTYLITFDEAMRSYIRNINPYNDKIIERFVSK